MFTNITQHIWQDYIMDHKRGPLCRGHNAKFQISIIPVYLIKISNSKEEQQYYKSNTHRFLWDKSEPEEYFILFILELHKSPVGKIKQVFNKSHLWSTDLTKPRHKSELLAIFHSKMQQFYDWERIEGN